MKRKISNIISGIAATVAFAGLWSCSAENPFDSEGTGIVQLRTVVNSITTRTEDEAQSDLEKKCVVYISDKSKPKGEALVYKIKGLDNLSPQITLKAGNYVAEAWTGDSVSASYDKKFYRGYQEFDVTKGSTSNVVVNCQIANVVASINTNTIRPELMKDDYIITIKNSRAELTFNKENAVDGKAYFMMPQGDETLEYSISGTRSDGEHFDYDGKIENVERAHHYILNIEYNPISSENPGGYVFIKINIKDEEIKNDNVTVFTRPTITGVEFDIEKKLKFINEESIPEVVSVQICGDGIENIMLTPKDDCGWKEILGLDVTNDGVLTGQKPVNFAKLNPSDPIVTLCEEKGINYIAPQYNENTKIETAYLNFSKELFLRLTESDKLHELEIRVSDFHNQESTAMLRTARTETAAIDDPIEINPVADKDYMSIKANSAYLTFTLAPTYQGTPGVEYSKANEDNWTFVAAPIPAGKPGIASTRADDNANKIKLTGLEEGTTYKYRACCGDFRGKDIFTFTTESRFIIPNASMEDWSPLTSNSKVMLPSDDGTVSFWDSGNHGSATMNKTLTQGSDQMKHSGEKAAELVSQFVGIGTVGKFAAGNLFAGSYDKTDGTDGELTFGRSYNGSHPTALSFWANYRPGKGVKSKGADSNYIGEGELDNSQIYVALSTKPISIKTKDGKQLFNKDAQEILAYGEVTWKDNFGPNGELQQVSITLEYNDRAKTEEAKYLIIVCSASKYGDYFSGGEKSTMYLDDFELIYE